MNIETILNALPHDLPYWQYGLFFLFWSFLGSCWVLDCIGETSISRSYNNSEDPHFQDGLRLSDSLLRILCLSSTFISVIFGFIIGYNYFGVGAAIVCSALGIITLNGAIYIILLLIFYPFYFIIHLATGIFSPHQKKKKQALEFILVTIIALIVLSVPIFIYKTWSTKL